MADRCRSCDAPIDWVLTAKGSRMPLDPGDHDDGNLIVVDGIATSTTIRPARRSHFVHCPNATQHRRRKAKR